MTRARAATALSDGGLERDLGLGRGRSTTSRQKPLVHQEALVRWEDAGPKLPCQTRDRSRRRRRGRGWEAREGLNWNEGGFAFVFSGATIVLDGPSARAKARDGKEEKRKEVRCGVERDGLKSGEVEWDRRDQRRLLTRCADLGGAKRGGG